MRCIFALLGLCVASAASQSSDDIVSQWVQNTVESNTRAGDDKPKLNLNPTVIDSVIDCYTSDGSTGYCTKYFDCEPDTSEARIYVGNASQICKTPYVCCKEDNIISRKKNGDETTTKWPVQIPPKIGVKIKAPPDTLGVKTKNKAIVCGQSNPGASVGVRLGSEDTRAEFGEYPWMIALLRRHGSDAPSWSADYLGVGTLIHPRVVLTVAHNLYETETGVALTRDQLKCRAGEYDPTTTDEIYPHQDKNVEKYIIHDKYMRGPQLNDAVLLFMESPFDLEDPHIGIACLATFPVAANTLCYGTGWGINNHDDQEDSPRTIPKKVEFEIVASSVCEDTLQRKRYGPFFRLHNSFMCAKAKSLGIDHCDGDGGSPLVCPIDLDDEQRLQVHGMVCHGLECGKKLPGVYVDVPRIKFWVDKVFRQEKLDIYYKISK